MKRKEFKFYDFNNRLELEKFNWHKHGKVKNINKKTKNSKKGYFSLQTLTFQLCYYILTFIKVLVEMKTVASDGIQYIYFIYKKSKIPHKPTIIILNRYNL